jgi:hypothetical protein
MPSIPAQTGNSATAFWSGRMCHACSSANWPTVTCAAEAETSRIADVRDRETIDSELRLLAAVRRVCRDHGGPAATIGQ